jgi:hypothetical protein
MRLGGSKHHQQANGIAIALLCVASQIPLPDEIFQQEAPDPGSEAALFFMAPSVYPFLEATVGFCQQLRCHGEITLRRAQVDVTKIGGQGRQKELHVRTSPIPFGQPVDGERVATISHGR